MEKKQISYQKQAEIAIELINDVKRSNPDISTPAWGSAFATCIIQGCLASLVSYEDFCSEQDRMKVFYKSWSQEVNDSINANSSEPSPEIADEPNQPDAGD